MGARRARGCGGIYGENGEQPFPPEYRSGVCPRRLVIRDPDIGRALDLYGHTDGVLGVDVLDLPAVVGDAMAVISDARAWRTEREMERMKAEAAKGRKNGN